MKPPGVAQPGCGLVVLAVVLGLLVSAQAGAQQGVEPLAPSSALRLDEERALFSLTPYRHARGLRFHERYMRSEHASWVRRAAFSLDWGKALPAGLRGRHDAPVHPRPRWRAGQAFYARTLAEPAGWPLSAGTGAFVAQRERGGTLVSERGFEIDERVVPWWLRQLDPHFAAAYVTIAGCGRGGDCRPGVPFPPAAMIALWTTLTAPPAPSPWCRERPVRVLSHGGEQDVFYLLRCDGSVAPGALERLSLLARPPGVPRPDALPFEADDEARPGEWLPGIRPLHPRLLWVLERISREYPWRGIYIYSGYRPSLDEDGKGQPESQHHHGRALDLRVQDVSNEDLLALCWELSDVSCGYYPNHKFVHIDVRGRETGRGVWVDASQPGERSGYLDSWPGVVEDGRVVHQRRE